MDSNEGQPKFNKGQEVRLISERDQLGVITRNPQKLANEFWYTVNFGGGNIVTVPESNIEPYEAERDLISLLKAGAYANKETFSKLITFTKIKYPLKKNIYSFKSSRTAFFEYQLKPVLKFIDSPNQRLLVADEVGLGKTIEAGYIIAEQRARHTMERVLVVCPSALTGKWQNELESKFGDKFEILNSSDIKEFLMKLDREGEAMQLKGICSLQTLRGRSILEQWEALTPPLYLVIIDEAHHLRNPGTLSQRMGAMLSDSADALLMLTATPIQIGNENLFYLLKILNPDEFEDFLLFKKHLEANQSVLKAMRILRNSDPPDLVNCKEALREVESTSQAKRFLENPFYQEVLYQFDTIDSGSRRDLIELQRNLNSLNVLSHILTRTRKRDVKERVQRDPYMIPVKLTDIERDFYNAVTRFVSTQYGKLGLGAFGQFISIMPQRQVASCIPAMVNHYSEMLSDDDIGGLDAEASDLAVEDWVDNGSEEEGDFGNVWLQLKRLMQSLKIRDVDSKFDALSENLLRIDEAEPGRKIIIFSYFKRTLEYLSKRLGKIGYKNVVISGSYPKDERDKRVVQFRDDPETRIMCSSEVGSEGLDFQFCHILVNYDLPWNPMVVEQRIGRLDRIGQKSERILIYNFSIPGTIEDRILNRLYMRIRIFEESIGDLEAILGEEIKSLTVDLLKSELTPEEQDKRISEAADIIERRRQELDQFEKESAKFIGHDEFFLDEVERIKKHRRYISSDELKVFVDDFICRHYPKATIETTNRANIHVMNIDNQFIQFLRNCLPSDDKALLQFLPRAYQKKLEITFDSETAFANPKIELITIYHPIVRAMIFHAENHPDEMHPVARIKLLSDNFDKGILLYFIYLIEATAARSYRSLEPIFVALPSLSVLNEDTSEDLLFEVVASGLTPELVQVISPEEIERAVLIAHDTFGKRMQSWKADLDRNNEALILNRLNSLEQSYHAKYGKKEELLGKALAKQSAPQYIRMLEGGLRNLTADYEAKKSAVVKGRRINISFHEIAAGYIEVTN